MAPGAGKRSAAERQMCNRLREPAMKIKRVAATAEQIRAIIPRSRRQQGDLLVRFRHSPLNQRIGVDIGTSGAKSGLRSAPGGNCSDRGRCRSHTRSRPTRSRRRRGDVERRSRRPNGRVASFRDPFFALAFLLALTFHSLPSGQPTLIWLTRMRSRFSSAPRSSSASSARPWRPNRRRAWARRRGVDGSMLTTVAAPRASARSPTEAR